MTNTIARSFIRAFIMGVIFVYGETIIRIFLPSQSVSGDLPIYVYNVKMSFWTLMGYSSIWMAVIAGVFTIIIGAINTKCNKNSWVKIPYIFQVLLGFISIIVVEFCFGYILNIHLGLNVWDYSFMKYHFMGQIGFLPSLMWLVLTPSIIYVDDVIRHYIWDSQPPDKFYTYYTDMITRIAWSKK